MTFACSLSPLPSLEEIHAVLEAPQALAQVASPILRAQLDLVMDHQMKVEEPITLSLSNQTHITLSGTASQTLRQSLQAAQGQVEIITHPQQECIEFRYDRVSGEGECYPTRLILPYSALSSAQ